MSFGHPRDFWHPPFSSFLLKSCMWELKGKQGAGFFDISHERKELFLEEKMSEYKQRYFVVVV